MKAVAIRVGFRETIRELRVAIAQYDDLIGRNPGELVLVARRAAFQERLRIAEGAQPIPYRVRRR